MSTEYKPISELEKFEGSVSLNDLILLSKQVQNTKGNTEYKSNRAEVRSFVGTLSSELVTPLSVEITKPLKDLAYMNPDDLNYDPNITAFTRKSVGAVTAGDFAAISSIHWTDGVIDEIGSVSLDDVKAKVTDIDTHGTPIAKIDGQQIYNGLDIKQTTTQGFEIANINGTAIYGGQDTTIILSITSKGNDIAKVVTSSPTGSTEYTLKNGIDITPAIPTGSTSQVGQVIFKVNDTPVYNNLSVTSLVSNSNPLGAPIADINGNKIYNGVVIGNKTTLGLTIATINGQELKNGINVTNGITVGSVIANINGTDIRNGIEVAGNTKGDVIANINGTQLRNGVNVDNMYDSNSGVKLANIAGVDVYGPGTDISALATTGTKIANVKTASGKTVDLFSGEHPHVHITQAEYDALKASEKLDPNTYYFTEGRASDTGYDDVGVLYRYQSKANAKGEYQWLEIWPDGWCRQGGTLNLTDTKVNTVKLLVEFESVNYNVQLTRHNPTGCGSPKDTTNIVLNSLKVNLFLFIGVCGNAHTTVCWIAEGKFNQDKLNDILSKYSNYTTTLIGIVKSSTTIAGGNSVVGQIVAYAGADTPAGWLLCDGTEVEKSVYPELYAVIGDKFGTSKDATKFILPKLTDERYLQGYVEAGKQYDAGLPNITGNIENTGFYGTKQGTGALTRSNIWQNSFTPDRANDNTEVYGTLNFNASNSSSIYGAANTVRPKSLTVRYLICWKATDAGAGGGVIDGTILAGPTSLGYNLFNATTKEIEYVVNNDCLLNINAKVDWSGSWSELSTYVNEISENTFIAAYKETSTGVDPRAIISLLPVKKGVKIKFKLNETLAKTYTDIIRVTEYKLKSLTPQIAMPDWDENKKIDLIAINGTNGTYKVVDNGYIFVHAGDAVSFIITVNGCEVFSTWSSSPSTSDPCSIIPVSINDEIKWTFNIITGGGTPSARMHFYPCKPVPQKDCASYCIETWHDANGNWCRIYSDGWCEQGGRLTFSSGNLFNQTVTLRQAYANVNYMIMLTPSDVRSGFDKGGDVQAAESGFGNVKVDSFMCGINNGYGTNLIMCWETKGWIK